MEPCIAAAVLNHTQKKAWVAHGSGWSNNPLNFDDMMGDAQNGSMPDDAITICLAGACLSKKKSAKRNGYNKLILEDREYVLREVTKCFPDAELENHFHHDASISSMDAEFAFDKSKEKWVSNVTTFK